MRKLLINASLACVSIIFVLVVLEIALRLFSSIGPRSGYLSPATSLSVEITPRTRVFERNYSGTLVSRDFRVPYTLNSLGFREKELNFQELATHRPFLFTGDSYFHGWGVSIEERVSERFAAQLRQKNIDSTTVNFAFPGFGTYQYLDIINLYATKINSRLVIIGFFIGNDFLDDMETLTFSKSAPENTKMLGLYLYKAKSLLRAFLRSSPLVNLLKYSLWDIPPFRRLFDMLSLKNDRILLYEKRESPLQNKFYHATFAAFDQIAEVSRTSHIPVLVVLVPDDLQIIRPELFSEYDFNKPQRMVTAHLNELGVPSIDLLPYFLGRDTPRRFYFREDRHWNEEGHALTVEIIFEYLRSNMQQLIAN